MRVFLTIVLLSLAAILPLQLSAQEAGNAFAGAATVEPEWVVVLSDPRPARLQGWVRTDYGKSSGNYGSSVELKRFGNKIVSRYDMELRDQWFIESLGVYCLVVGFNSDKEQTLTALKKNKLVQWVQPSNEFELFNSDRSLEQDNASVSNITLPKSADGEGVVIAIIDSAVDVKHQDIAGSISKSNDFVIAGKDSGGGEAHGTAIAGVITTQPDTKLGVAGVSPAAKLELYRACWESKGSENTNCNTLSLARALDSVVRSEADILNLSLSGPKDLLLDQLVQRIIARGKMVVAAFDPKRANGGRFPTEREGVLIVRARGLDDKYSDVFTAPGARVVAVPGNRYDFSHGHSIATAYTSGLLALRKQQSMQASADEYSSVETDWRNTSQSKFAKDIIREILRKS